MPMNVPLQVCVTLYIPVIISCYLLFSPVAEIFKKTIKVKSDPCRVERRGKVSLALGRLQVKLGTFGDRTWKDGW